MNRIVPNNAIEMSVKFLDIPFDLSKLLDESGNPRTPLAFCEATNTPIEYNQDKTRVIIWFEFSYEDGDFQGIESALAETDLKALFGGVQATVQKDITSTLETDVRILNYSKFVELKTKNSNWVDIQDETDAKVFLDNLSSIK